MSTQNTVLFALLTCFLSRPAWGGLAEIDAGGEGVFTEYRCSVIVAKVDKLWKVASPDSDIKNHAILSPLATLAGTFDPSLHSSLPVDESTPGMHTHAVCGCMHADYVHAPLYRDRHSEPVPTPSDPFGGATHARLGGCLIDD